MASKRKTSKLIAIVGPTASGKSELAIRVAKDFNGEIIAADSRTIYKGLDIGTAKPSLEERAGIKHYGFDLIEPSETFSAAQFQQLANQWIDDIYSRGHLPIIAGGTGLYVDAILFNYRFGLPADATLRNKLQRLTMEQLWEYCRSNNVSIPENAKNKRYVIRAIEQGGVNKNRSKQIRQHTFVVGIAPESHELRLRIEARAERIFSSSVVKEAALIAKQYGWKTSALSANIYPIIHDLLIGKLSKEEAIKKFIITDYQLAKRQLTWFRRNPAIHWTFSTDAAYSIIRKYISK